jgi:nucleotide-binding universal stress UspA family protein
MYRWILVPTDGGTCGEKAAHHAVALASMASSNVVFLFVIESLRNYHEGVMNDVRKRLSDEGEKSLASVRRIAADARVHADVELLEGDPADVIVRRTSDFELVVMGSHGKGLWKRLTVGSVTQAVLRRVERAVLLLPCQHEPSAG